MEAARLQLTVIMEAARLQLTVIMEAARLQLTVIMEAAGLQLTVTMEAARLQLTHLPLLLSRSGTCEAFWLEIFMSSVSLIQSFRAMDEARVFTKTIAREVGLFPGMPL